jgi:hypothetical protein
MGFRDGGAFFWAYNRAERAVRDLPMYWMEEICLGKRRRALRLRWTRVLHSVEERLDTRDALVCRHLLRERKERGAHLEERAVVMKKIL